MKISIIVASNSEVIVKNKNEILNLICSQSYKNGLDVVCKFVLKMEPETIVKTLKICREISDQIIFMCDTNFEKCYVCKKIICDEFSTTLVNNEFAKKNIEEYLRKINIPMKKEDQTFFQLPKNSRCIKNPLGVFQGFLLENNNQNLFFLPLDYNDLYHMFFSSVLPFILQKKDNTTCTYIFKTFGIRYNEMTSLLRENIKNKYNIQILCSEYLLEGEVFVLVPQKSQKYADNIIGNVYTKLLPYIYSDSDATLSEVISEFLCVRNKNIVFAEDYTCGKLCNMFCNKLSDKNILSQGFIVPDEKSKINILGVPEKIFNKPNIDLGEVAYQMALGALEVSQADFTVATFKGSNLNEFVFAIGSNEGIHVYSEKLFGGNEQKIDLACNIVLFKLLKKLKKESFNLGETV